MSEGPGPLLESGGEPVDPSPFIDGQLEAAGSAPPSSSSKSLIFITQSVSDTQPGSEQTVCKESHPKASEQEIKPRESRGTKPVSSPPGEGPDPDVLVQSTDRP